MAHEENHGKPLVELANQSWDLARKIQFALFTSWDGHRMQQWPLTAVPDQDNQVIDFLVADGKYDHLADYPEAMLGFADPGANAYVVMHGRAVLTNDRAKIAELFTPFVRAWWDSPEDPTIRLLSFTPDHAELWNGPNKLVAGAIMLTAALTGTKPAVGDHGTVRL